MDTNETLTLIIMNTIGIKQEQASLLVEELNKLLANYMVFYQTSRSLHWNIRGEKFFELHIKFEELYTNLVLKVSSVKESIQAVLDSFSLIIPQQRKLLTRSAEADDEGTNALMSDYIREQEKLVWMYSAYLNQ